MVEERTEKPTKRKLKKAREKGEVAKSSFFAGAIVFTGGILLIWGSGSYFAGRFAASMKAGLQKSELDGAFQKVAGPLLLPVGLFLLAIFAVAIIAHLVQTGWIWSTESLRPKWRRKKGERRFLLPLMQAVAIGGIGYLSIRAKLDPNLLFTAAESQGAFLFKKIIFLSALIGASLLIMGLFDFFYQKQRYYKQMQMTPQEKKEELRETEGDPQIKSRLRDRRH
ncbi:MAG: EscU/YscU/HrcU family type III secretion system export apparatus switch protein [Chlamydiales bacterium]|nr:EscU/YscU/HrcU family type III secretion system export apparatus switch protein [Chlamydiales bacterium]